MTKQEEKQMAEDRAYVEMFWNGVEELNDHHSFYVGIEGVRLLTDGYQYLHEAWAQARKRTEAILHEANYLKANLSVLQFAKNEDAWAYAVKLLKERLRSLVEGPKDGPFGPWPV